MANKLSAWARRVRVGRGSFAGHVAREADGKRSAWVSSSSSSARYRSVAVAR